jgi:4-oxalocrotonate tautomerase
MWEGRTPQEKNKIIASVTAAISESMDVKPEWVTVLLQEYPKDNWGIDGKPASEAYDDLRAQ